MFPFNRPNYFRRYCHTEECGVALIKSFSAVEEAERVVIKIYARELERLPRKCGLMDLSVEGIPTITDTTLPVYLSDNEVTKPILLADGSIMTAVQIANGEHIILYYKEPCRDGGVIKVVYAEPLPLV